MTAAVGRRVEIDAPSVEERTWIFAALTDSTVHVPLGLVRAPTRSDFDRGMLDLSREGEVHREAVRLLVLRLRATSEPIGFFIDFGWDAPNDTTREIDLAITKGSGPHRSSIYLDAIFTVGAYLFSNRLAKRIRWRVPARAGGRPRRFERLGARWIQSQDVVDPRSGDVRIYHFYEFSRADFEALGRRHGIDPYDAAQNGTALVWRPRRSG